MVGTQAPRATGYLYPWDVLGDPGAVHWIKASGVDRVALAAAYHSVRAGTPRHPGRRVVDAQSAALYVPAADAFAANPIVPGSASEWTGTDNAFGEAASVLRAANIPVDAWTVLTHSSAAGGNNPGMCVRNAFGEVYSYALCPSHPEVRGYAAGIVAQVLAHGQPDGLILEAVGPLGFSHQNRHEKTEGAEYSPWVQALLSLCFCEACKASYEARGLPADVEQDRVRAAVMESEDPGLTAATAAGAQDFLPLLEVRWDAAAALLDQCLTAVAASGSNPQISLHASPDPWNTGPFLPVEALRRSRLWRQRGDVTAVVPCWGNPDDGALTVQAMSANGVRTGAYVLALPPKAPDGGGLAGEWGALHAAGADELHVYHLGLASTRRLSAISAALAGLR
ncbi:hypothetical protein DC347_03775 [Pseudarthrobacter sp. AG30]|uniref:hypothetical protein n=1 Tax=Pseudarthrobacter sp. AG30 TaxID=2249742 RepID=UPI000D64C9A0|nr:hypothetical protein [Pseudarthrobacter sp. AG30]RAX17858.1 hypothetical protein DC347_03775 [Pseudarthrobacter sp. AG30]